VLVSAPLEQDDLVRLAVRLCRCDDANVAVVAGPCGGVIFVPV
jgi:hypothetical protein